MLLESGLVLMADTRTNAGIDNFSTFKKLHVLAETPDRQVYAATAGNLSLSQSAIALAKQRFQAAADSGDPNALGTMFDVARLTGDAVAEVGETTGAALAREHIDHTLEVLVAGRIGNGPQKLYLVYTIGNFIECTEEVPFLQIGETKYGRPILDRALSYSTPLAEAVKIGFLSFDSTMESNLGVAHPIDVLVLPSSRNKQPLKRRIEEDDPYFAGITRQWAKILNDGVTALPSPPWLDRSTI